MVGTICAGLCWSTPTVLLGLPRVDSFFVRDNYGTFVVPVGTLLTLRAPCRELRRVGRARLSGLTHFAYLYTASPSGRHTQDGWEDRFGSIGHKV